METQDKPKTVNQMAYELLQKADVNISGGRHNLYSLVAESKGMDDLNALKDACCPDWREADAEAGKLYSEIYKSNKSIEQYSELRMRETCAEVEAFFALGFAAAFRLLGR